MIVVRSQVSPAERADKIITCPATLDRSTCVYRRGTSNGLNAYTELMARQRRIRLSFSLNLTCLRLCIFIVYLVACACFRS
jgi:hypothetical protein